MVVGLLLAQKMWDDAPLNNRGFIYLFPIFKIKQLNCLEIKFLTVLDYRLTIHPSVYSQYYFELRALSYEHTLRVTVINERLIHGIEQPRRTHLLEVYKRYKNNCHMTVEDLLHSRSRLILS